MSKEKENTTEGGHKIGHAGCNEKGRDYWGEKSNQSKGDKEGPSSGWNYKSDGHKGKHR